MPGALNRVQFIGNLGADPEMRYTASGKPVTNMSLVINEGPRDTPLWVKVVAWEKLAEHCNQYLRKGDTMFVEGRLKHVEWAGNDGQKHSTLQVTAFYNGVRFLNQRRNDGEVVALDVEDEELAANLGVDELPW